MFVAPLLGAAAGGALFGQIGMGVGWMVGSWLYSQTNKQKNQVFDPGAQEMPRFNQALRGTTMPILFGTNRVSSQIVWQNNFQSIRSENRQAGGGKGGGSGMGGKGQQAGSQITYEYKWDLVYHLGMSHVKVGLFRAWVGANKISDETILRIGDGGSGGGFGAIPNPNDGDQTASLNFVESFFANANDPPDEYWPHIQTTIGKSIVWPHTTWIGFKQLDLGTQAVVPQITWEVGPGDIETTYNNAFVFSKPNRYNSSNSMTLLGGGMNEFLHCVYVADSTVEDEQLAIEIISSTDPSKITQYTVSQLREMAGVKNYIAPFTTNISFRGSSIICNGKYIIVGLQYLFASGALGVAFCMFKFGADPSTKLPTLSFLSSASYNKGTTNLPYTYGFKAFVGSDGGPDSKIYVVGRKGLSAATTAISCIGTVGQLGGVTTPSSFPSDFDYFLDSSDAGGYSTEWSHEAGFMVSKVSFTGPVPVWTDAIYYYIPKVVMNNMSGSPGILKPKVLTDQYASYPNGFMLKISLSGDTYSGHSVANAEFVSGENDPTLAIPFSDSGKRFDGTSDIYIDYWAFNVTMTTATGAVIIPFLKYDHQSAGAGGTADTQYFANMKIFVYNPLAGNFVQYGNIGGVIHTLGNIHSGSAEAIGIKRLSAAMLMYWDQNTNKIYFPGYINPVAASALRYTPFCTQFGSFSINGGDDITPPEIIREILCNPQYGIGLSYTDLDTASYQLAVQYCTNQEIKVSTQYRREEGWLDIIRQLLSLYGGYMTYKPHNGKIYFGILEFSSTPVRVIDNDRLLINQKGEEPIKITKGALQDTFNKIRVNYIDRALDYQQNQVEEADEVDQDISGIRMREFPPQFVMSEKTARTIAIRGLINNLYARDQYEFNLGWKDADLEPGDTITLVDSFGNLNTQVRIVEWRETKRGQFSVRAVQELGYAQSAIVNSAFNVTSASVVNNLSGAARIPLYSTAYELPLEFSSDSQPRLYFGYVPDGRVAGAHLYVSADGTTYGKALTVDPYPLAGVLLTDLPDSDEVVNDVQVYLFPASSDPASRYPAFNETMPEVTEATRQVGGGAMWVGSEMLAYENVTLVAQNQYKLGKVYRAWGGTFRHGHNSGDYWVKQGGGIFSQTYTEDQIGRTIYYKIVPFNNLGYAANISSINGQSYTVKGVAFAPRPATQPSFVWSGYDYRGTTYVKVNSTIDLTFMWRDSAQKSGFGQGGFGRFGYGNYIDDVSSSNWLVEMIGSGQTVAHSVVVSTPAFTYPRATNVANNGAWTGRVAIRVTHKNGYASARAVTTSMTIFN